MLKSFRRDRQCAITPEGTPIFVTVAEYKRITGTDDLPAPAAYLVSQDNPLYLRAADSV
jgi:hypothetical protein